MAKLEITYTPTFWLAIMMVALKYDLLLLLKLIKNRTISKCSVKKGQDIKVRDIIAI